MQGDYFTYNNQVYPGYTPYTCAPYTQNVMPPTCHRTIESLKQKSKNKSMSASRHFDDHSTDESIHLIRSRRSRDDRYDANQMLKKRSQSGTSIMKGMASQLSVPRSHSDERSLSPSLINVEKRKNRKSNKSKSNKPTFSQLEEGDEDSFTYSGGNRLVEPSYFDQPPQQHYHQQFYSQQPQMQYAQYQQYPQDPYQMQQFYQQPGYNTAPPGAPNDFYQAGNPSQSYYQQADVYSSNGTQTFVTDQQQQQQTQGLPNGAKIVAEYFLGYLDEHQNNAYSSPQPKPIQQEQGECAPQMQQYYQPQQQVQYPQYSYYQQPQQYAAAACPPGCEPGQAVCPPGCEPGMVNLSESDKEEVDIEIWEKPNKKKKNRRSGEDLRKLSDIIDALEVNFFNLDTQRVPSGGSRCATGRDDYKVPLINSRVPAWIPPSAIKREALTTNIDSDDEELFRKVRGLLNKLTPEKFEKLSVEFCNLSIRSPKALKGIIVLILDKALSESAYSALYAQLCQRLDKWVPNFEPAVNQPNAKPITTFRKLLLTVCQHEFDNRSGYASKLLLNNVSNTVNNSHNNNNTSPLTAENYSDDEKKAQLELARTNAKKKMLGNVKFIGELGRIDLLTEAILHKCIKTLLEKQRDEKYSDMSEDLECLCKMMPTIGKKLDQGEAVKLMDQYFERMKKLCSMKSHSDKLEWALPMRIRFMLQDLIDMRAKQWQPRQTQIDQAPKTMHEVRNGALMEEMAAAALTASSRDAAQEPTTVANACFNISSLNLNSNSALVMNMYHQLSQQPNVSLLNAINTKIATNKNNNIIRSKQQQQQVYECGDYLKSVEEVSVVETVPVPKQQPSVAETTSNNNGLNLVTRQSSSKQNFIKQLAPNPSDQESNLQKTNFSFQRGNQRAASNQQSATDQQKLLKTNFHNNKNQFIDTDPHHQHHQQQAKRLPPASGNFNWNQPHPAGLNATDQQQLANLPHQQILQVKTPNMQSISSSSSPFSSTSSLSASPPLPIEPATNNTNNTINPYKSTEPAAFNQTNLNNNKYNNIYNINTTNKQRQQQQFPQSRQQQFYHQNANTLARQALGVSTNDVLPLNKPIIPLDKITKYEHPNSHKSSSNGGVKTAAKAPVNIFNANIYNLTPSGHQNSSNTPAVKSSQVVDDALRKSLLNLVDKFLNENNKNEDHSIDYEESIMNECLSKINEHSLNFLTNLNSFKFDFIIKGEFKDLKLSNEKFSEVIRLIITHSLSKTDSERLNISRLFMSLHAQESITADIFLNGFKVILQSLANLESEYHCVKSNISMYAARAVCDLIITFDDLGVLMRHGAHYPLFFLCMQNIHKLKTKEWLRAQLEKSKISLIEMLPASDRHKDRLVQILEDRELSFVYPMLKIESALLEKIQTETMTNENLKKWIEANVSPCVTGSNDFIHSLVTCIVKNAAENSVLSSDVSDLDSKMDKKHVQKQKELIRKYQGILQEYLGMAKMKRAKQVEAIYAMQVYANSKGFPKYFLAHLFHQMYDLEIVEEEAFLQWKDEINESYPNKGQALFHLQRWFNWLQEAEEESSGSETEALGEKLPKSNLINKENKEHIEV